MGPTPGAQPQAISVGCMTCFLLPLQGSPNPFSDVQGPSELLLPSFMSHNFPNSSSSLFPAQPPSLCAPSAWVGGPPVLFCIENPVAKFHCSAALFAEVFQPLSCAPAASSVTLHMYVRAFSLQGLFLT